MEIAVMAAGTQTLTNKEVETSLSFLSFEMTGATGGATTPGAILDAIIGAATLNLQKQDAFSTVTLTPALSLRDLAEISSHNNGVVDIDVTGANATVKFAVEVSHEAALALSDNAKLMVAMTGIPVGTSTLIDGVDHPVSTTEFIQYESKYINANVGKEFGVSSAYAIALPTASITTLELTYENGKTIKLSAREIKQLLRDSQDPIYNLDGAVFFGYDKWSVLSVEHVVIAKVTLSASTNFYLLQTVAV